MVALVAALLANFRPLEQAVVKVLVNRKLSSWIAWAIEWLLWLNEWATRHLA